MLQPQRLVPILLVLVAACGGAEAPPTAAHPAPAFALLDHVEGLGANAGEVVLADDLSGFDGQVAPAGWTLFTRSDKQSAPGARVVSLVRAVETLHGDIDFHTVVKAGPVGLRVARLPADLGPIPDAEPGSDELRAWLVRGATRGDAREVRVESGAEGPQDAWFPEKAERPEQLSSRILVAIDLTVGVSSVGVVEVRRRPSFEVQYQSAVYGAPSFRDQPVRGRVNLGGDHRMALVVPGGTSVAADLGGDSHLAERTSVQLAIGALSGVEPGELVPLSGRLELVADGAVVASQAFTLDPATVAADRRWRGGEVARTPAPGRGGAHDAPQRRGGAPERRAHPGGAPG
ncbi:MAG: hypothetical protein P1V81_09660, partial [Planctomycetota bacterium]|nr:hypothetical protein [Planctomycetota bacterium]